MQSPSGKANPAKSKIPWYRRSLVVEPALQFRIVAQSFIGALGIICIAFFCGTWLPQNSSLPAPVCYMIGIVLFFAMIFWQLDFSNRIVGPIYHMRQHMIKTLADGKVRPLSTRGRDFQHETIQVYNQMLEQLIKCEKQDEDDGSR